MDTKMDRLLSDSRYVDRSIVSAYVIAVHQNREESDRNKKCYLTSSRSGRAWPVIKPSIPTPEPGVSRRLFLLS